MNYYPYIIDGILKINSTITGEIDNIKISYDPNRNFNFNKTAGEIFYLIQQGNDFNKIVAEIINKYNIADNRIDSVKEDILDILFDFYQLGFLGWRENISPFSHKYSLTDQELSVEFCWLDNINILKSTTFPIFKNPIISNEIEFSDKFILQSMYLNKDFVVKLYADNKYIGYLYLTTRDGNSSFIIKSLSCDFSNINADMFYRFCKLISKNIYKKLPYKIYKPNYINLFIDLVDYSYPYEWLKDFGFQCLGDKRYENCLNHFSTYLYHKKI